MLRYVGDLVGLLIGQLVHAAAFSALVLVECRQRSLGIGVGLAVALIPVEGALAYARHRGSASALGISLQVACGVAVAAQLHIVQSTCQRAAGASTWPRLLALASVIVGVALVPLGFDTALAALSVPFPVPATLMGGSAPVGRAQIVSGVARALSTVGVIALAAQRSASAGMAAVVAGSGLLGAVEALRWHVAAISLASVGVAAAVVWTSAPSQYDPLDHDADDELSLGNEKVDAQPRRWPVFGSVCAVIALVLSLDQNEHPWARFRSVAFVDGPRFEDTMLVVVFNSPYYGVIETYEDLYRPFFPNIAYCAALPCPIAESSRRTERDDDLRPARIAARHRQRQFWLPCPRCGHRATSWLQLSVH